MATVTDRDVPRKLTTGLVLGIVGAVGFSGKAIIVKLAYRHGVDAVTLIALRMLFALPLFAAMAWWAGRGSAALTRRDWLSVAGLGFSGYYLSSYLDFLGLQYITASLERLILYTNPTMVMLLGWLLYRRPLRRAQLAGMALSYLGVLVVFSQELSLAGSNIALGTLLVFGSAASYAVYLIHSGELVKRLGALRLVGLASTFACVFALLQYAVLRPLDTMLVVAAPVIWLSVVNAVLCTAVPVLAVMMAVERLGPGLAAQIGLLGPIATIAMGVVWLNEPFTALVLAGTVLVMSGIYVFSRSP